MTSPQTNRATAPGSDGPPGSRGLAGADAGPSADTDGPATGGVLGARPPAAQTFHGRDPDLVAGSAICQDTPTKCQARTRLYRNGELELEGFPVADISDHLTDEEA